MDRFLADYSSGLRDGRYVVAELPALPFPDQVFELAVCSHLLFLYGDQLSGRFHLDSLRSLIRVAKEVRVFPLIDLDGKLSRHVAPAVEAFRSEGFPIEIVDVNYEFQRGGNQLMRIRTKC